MTREELIEKVKLLPYSPGVYMMKDKQDKIIYVGKSKSLRNRVSSYFQEPDKLNVKTAKLVSQICDFNCVYTDTETEALILENELIKRHTPKYNIKLKDAKNYPYVKITHAPYPAVVFTRSRKDDRSRYFGPYASSKVANDIIETVNRTFMLATCGKRFEYGKEVSRPCLNYHIGKCLAPCSGKIASSDYQKVFDEVGEFLKGDYVKAIEGMRVKMLEASDDLRFEVAAQYRDRISSLEKLSENQKIVTDAKSDRDVIGLYESETLCVISVLFVRTGRLIDKDLIFLSPDELTDETALADFVMRYYSDKIYIPKTILLSFSIDDEQLTAASAYISGKAEHKVDLLIPQKGIKHDLVALACENAEQAVRQYSLDLGRSMKVLIHLNEILALDSLPSRIEAYDISNSGSESMYAGMVVLENGSFKKSDYRSFAIKTVDGVNDYAAMSEAIRRRLGRLKESREDPDTADESFRQMPDLMLIDGGVGHLSVVKPIVEEFGYPISVFGMIKDDFHKTRTITDGEHEISISHLQDIFTFIYKIQEEVHRYTFSRMDVSRRKSVKTSSLEEISGIGEAKARQLLKTMGSLSAIKRASIEELENVKGINHSLANNIFEHFHPNTEKES